MSWHLPFIIAHRGAPLLAPENTLSALREAKQQGAVAVECDIQLTKDHVPVILHDAQLARTTNLEGLLSQKNFATIRAASAGAWFSHEFAQEKIPSLQEWLETASELGLLLNLEIKARSAQQSKVLAALVCRAISRYYDPALLKPLVSSSNLLVLQYVRQQDKKLPLGYILSRPLSQALSDRLQKQQIISLHQPYTLMTKTYIAKLHAKKFRALAYTVNDPVIAQQLKENGIDGVFTDNPKLTSVRHLTS